MVNDRHASDCVTHEVESVGTSTSESHNVGRILNAFDNLSLELEREVGESVKAPLRTGGAI